MFNAYLKLSYMTILDKVGMTRKLWTDGWNSFWHFTFGALAFNFPVIILMFLVYQCLGGEGIYEKNVKIDLLEFFIGLISMIASFYTLKYYWFLIILKEISIINFYKE
jgi:hypothetical protein